MERQLSQRTVEQIDRQLEYMQMEQNDIMNGRGHGHQNYEYPGLKDFDGFEELNADGGEVVLEEVIISSSEPGAVPIEEDPVALGFKSDVQYYELMPSEQTGGLKHEVETSEDSDPEYVPAGEQKNGRKRKGTKAEPGHSRPSKLAKPVSKAYQPKYKTKQSKPGPKAKVADADLSKDELARRIQRRARNREAANRQRDKRVQIVTELENKVHCLEEENSGLKKENLSLKSEMKKLRQQLESQSQVHSSQGQLGLRLNQPTKVNSAQMAVKNLEPTQGFTSNFSNMTGVVQFQLAPQIAASQQNSYFISKAESCPNSARSTPNSVSTMNSMDQIQTGNQIQTGSQVFTGPLPSPFTQVLLMSPSMPLQNQFQFPTAASTVDPPKVQAAVFQKTVGSL